MLDLQLHKAEGKCVEETATTSILATNKHNLTSYKGCLNLLLPLVDRRWRIELNREVEVEVEVSERRVKNNAQLIWSSYLSGYVLSDKFLDRISLARGVYQEEQMSELEVEVEEEENHGKTVCALFNYHNLLNMLWAIVDGWSTLVIRINYERFFLASILSWFESSQVDINTHLS